jgi:hypothetical protein
MPIGATPDANIIHKSFSGDDVKALWKELEAGIETGDLLANLDPDVDLLPRMMFDTQRPHHKLLQEFGW